MVYPKNYGPKESNSTSEKSFNYPGGHHPSRPLIFFDELEIKLYFNSLTKEPHQHGHALDHQTDSRHFELFRLTTRKTPMPRRGNPLLEGRRKNPLLEGGGFEIFGGAVTRIDQ